MLKTKQIDRFAMWRKMYKYKKLYFSRSGPPAGQQGQNWPTFISKKPRFFKGGGARRATGTKLTLVYFQKRHDFSRPGPPAGQRGQKWPSFIFKKNIFFNSGCFSAFPREPTRSLFARGCWPSQHTPANRTHTPAIRPTYTGESYIHWRIDLLASSTVHV